MYLTKLKYKFTPIFYEKPYFKFFGNDFHNLPCFDANIFLLDELFVRDQDITIIYGLDIHSGIA